MVDPTDTAGAGGSRWTGRANSISGEQYDDRWRELAASGQSVHGEADFVCGFEPASVLDAGCGTGRVAIELAARGIDVVGVDLDTRMLEEAQHKAPDLAWVQADLSTARVDREFDVVVMAGNVMIFVSLGTERAVVANMASHVRQEGLLIAGFQTNRGYSAESYAYDCVAAGLRHVASYSTWQKGVCAPGDDYVVSVHQQPATEPTPHDDRRE